MRARALKRHGVALRHYQSDVLGLPVLRQALAIYLRESRGVQCTWEPADRSLALHPGADAGCPQGRFH